MALKIDRLRLQVTVDGREVSLAPAEWKVLFALLDADGGVLDRATLLRRIVGEERSLDLKTRTVDQHIARLRRKLGPTGRQRIGTRWGYGYQYLVR